jgi:micrococcal nuclease
MLALVTQVVDGDTIDVDISGKPYTVRYIGVDTPESTRSVEYFGSQATQVNKELVEGNTVTLVKDVSETDRFGRLLRYVFVGELFVNYELARQGYAYAVTYPPDIACKDIFRAAEMAARESGAGLWAATPAIDQATASPTPGEGSGNCDPAYPDVCIPPPPPDLDCNDISHRRFRVLSPDPHNFDVNVDGVGCER